MDRLKDMARPVKTVVDEDERIDGGENMIGRWWLGEYDGLEKYFTGGGGENVDIVGEIEIRDDAYGR